MTHRLGSLRILLLFFVCCYQLTATAQQLQATLSHYSTDNGLSSNAIAHIKQDDYGYIWIATWNGISRFDGFNFYNYRTGNGSRIPLLHNRAHDFVIDNQQNIWLRMYDGRVFVINRRTDKIENPLRHVNGLEDLKTQLPLMVTSGGDVLAIFDKVGIYKMRLDATNQEPQLITTGDLTVTSLAEGYHNDVWAGTNQGVHRLDLNNLTIEQKSYFGDEHITCLFSNGYNIYAGTLSGKIVTFSYGQEPSLIKETGAEVTNLYIDTYGLIWYSDRGFGVNRYIPSTGDTRRFTQDVPVPEYDGPGGECSESMGLLWTRMNHGGYGYYNREADEIEYFHNSPSNPWNLSNTINARLELDEGVVWESTVRRGLEKLEIQKNTIERRMLVKDASSSIENEIRAMLYDKSRRRLLLGNKNYTLYIISADGSRTTITHDQKGRSIGRPYGLMLDSKGTYWLCSKDCGLFHITPLGGDKYQIQNYCHSDNDEWSLSSNSAYSAVEDKHGNIWVATFGGGVNVLVPGKGGGYRVYHYKNVMRKYPYNSFLKVRTVVTDSDGNVWAGTTDGILILSLVNNNLSIKRLANSTERPEAILMSTDIVHLARDPKGNMWVGTNGGGLARTIGKDDKGCWLFESYTAEDGLPSEEIKSITFDTSGNAWFATDRELCSFDTSKNIFSTFGNLDGVDGTICSEGAALTLNDNNILFGTLNGYYVVDRTKLKNTTGSILKLKFTDFYLNGELQSPRLNDTYDYYVPESRRVELPTHNAMFSMRFASLNYQMQHRVHYQYMLQGYDKDWQNADRTRTVSYASLPTGSYLLRVKAFLLEAPENYDERTIEIIVPPYFLLSGRAIWGYLLLGVLCVLALMFWRQQQLAFRENRRKMSLSPEEMTYDSDEARQFLEPLYFWLADNYQRKNLRPEELVTLSNMSRSRFASQLEKWTELTPDAFVNDYRLHQALSLLKQTPDSLASIADATGFADESALRRYIRKRLGDTPEHIRSHHIALHSAHHAAPVEPAPTENLPAVPEMLDEYEIIDDE